MTDSSEIGAISCDVLFFCNSDSGELILGWLRRLCCGITEHCSGRVILKGSPVLFVYSRTLVTLTVLPARVPKNTEETIDGLGRS